MSLAKNMAESEKKRKSAIIEATSALLRAIPTGDRYCKAAAGFIIGTLLCDGRVRFIFSVEDARAMWVDSHMDNNETIYKSLLSFAEKLVEALGRPEFGFSGSVLKDEEMDPLFVPVEFIIPV